MVKCDKHRALIPESTCIARQRIIQKADTWNTNQRVAALDVQYACKGCEIGEKLLRGESIMEHQKTKICRVCQQEKPRADFYKNKAAKDGLESLCKKCKTEQSRANRSAKKTDTIQKNNHPVDLDEMVRQVFEQSGHPDQYKALEEAAFQAFRTPAMHMIAIVHGTV